MAELFHAERASDGRPVAIKVLLPQYARDPELVRMLADEARLQASLSHPNLVRVLDQGRVGRKAYIALELVDGASLRELLRAGKLPRPIAIAVACDVLRALVAVHAAGVVHRDVTPENVLISRAGEVKLGDFGIARSARAVGRTRTGVIKGKLAYLAPEQARGAVVGAPSDVFAAGLVLFEAVSGQQLLIADTEPELLRLAEAPVVRTCGSPDIDDVLRAMLAHEADARPTDLRVVIAQLEALGADRRGLNELVERARLHIGDDADLDDARPRTVRVVAPRRARRRFVPVAIASASVAAVISWLALRDGADPEVPRPRTAEAPRDATFEVAARLDIGGADDATPSDPPNDATPSRADMDARAARQSEADARGRGSATVAVDAGRPQVIAAADAAIGSAPADAGPPRGAGVDVHAAVAEVRATYRARGILDEDLPAESRTSLATAEANGDAATVARVRDAIAALRVDDTFVKRKLERLGAAMRSRGRPSKELEKLTSAALEELLDGRYEACNRHLNEIARGLGHSQ